MVQRAHHKTEQNIIYDSCKVCGVKMSVHPKCEGCGILIGPGHPESSLTVSEEGKRLCSFSLRNWKKCKAQGHTWRDFTEGRQENPQEIKTLEELRKISGDIMMRYREVSSLEGA